MNKTYLRYQLRDNFCYLFCTLSVVIARVFVYLLTLLLVELSHLQQHVLEITMHAHSFLLHMHLRWRSLHIRNLAIGILIVLKVHLVCLVMDIWI